MRTLLLLCVLLTVASCDAYSTVSKGLEQSNAVANDLATAVGSKPEVGFSWNNGRLVSVTVTFANVPPNTPTADIAKLASAAVAKRFKQKPEHIVLSFVLEGP